MVRWLQGGRRVVMVKKQRGRHNGKTSPLKIDTVSNGEYQIHRQHLTFDTIHRSMQTPTGPVQTDRWPVNVALIRLGDTSHKHTVQNKTRGSQSGHSHRLCSDISAILMLREWNGPWIRPSQGSKIIKCWLLVFWYDFIRKLIRMFQNNQI